MKTDNKPLLQLLIIFLPYFYPLHLYCDAQSHFRTDQTGMFETAGPFYEGKWWGPFHCPHREFAIGYELEYQLYRGSHAAWCAFYNSDGSCRENPTNVLTRDDNGVLGLRLYCGKVRNSTVVRSNDSAVIGHFPGWAEREYALLHSYYKRSYFCDHDYITGLIVRMQERQGKPDDAGITNVKFKCGDGQIIGGLVDYDVGEILEFKGKGSCSKGEAVCGVSLKTEYDHHDDNTGLNDMKVFCCSRPPPESEDAECTPVVKWYEVASFINTGETSTKYTYSTKVGISKETGSTTVGKESQSSGNDKGYSVEAELGPSYAKLKTKFEQKFTESKTVENEKQSSSLDIFGTETEAKQEVEVGPKHVIKILQKTGKCGSYSVKTGTFKREDECLQGFEESCKRFQDKENKVVSFSSSSKDALVIKEQEHFPSPSVSNNRLTSGVAKDIKSAFARVSLVLGCMNLFLANYCI